MDDGVSDDSERPDYKKLKEAQTLLSNSSHKKRGFEQHYSKILRFAELDMLIGKLKGTTKYEAPMR